MTSIEQNIAIAKACEWVEIYSQVRDWDGPRVIDWQGINETDPECNERRIVEIIPNYAGDLNAIHEAEQALSPDAAILYRHNLACNSDGRSASHRLTVEAAMRPPLSEPRHF